jgi:hypothetical protein
MAARRRTSSKAAAAPTQAMGAPSLESAAAQSPFVELGVTGLNTSGGRVWEEFLPQLQGPRANAIWREMSENDATCGAVLRAIEMLIRRVEWRIVPGGEDEATEVTDFVESCFKDMSETWPDTLGQILSFVPFGHSVQEEVYKRRLGPSDNPREHSRYDDGRIGWAKLAPRAAETIEEWLWDDEGSLVGLIQKAPPDYRRRTIPWNRLLLFRTTAHKGNPEGRSVLRTAYRSWHYKKRIEEIEGIGIERDLAGLPVAHVPPELLAADAPAALKAQLTQIALLVRNIRRDQKEGVVFPLSYDDKGNPRFKLELLSTGGRRQFDTTGVITRWDTRIAMSVLADFVLLGHEKVGSFALASNKTDIFAVALGAMLDTITEVINRYAIPRLLALNPFTFDQPPLLEHGDIETVDLEEIADYVSKLLTAGAIVATPKLERHLLQNAGLPEPDEGEGLEGKQEASDALLQQLTGAQSVQPPGTQPPPGPTPPGGPQPPVPPTGAAKRRRSLPR